MNMQAWPLRITWFRVVLIPVFLIVFYLPFATAHFWAMVIFGVAAITDWLDGYLARKYNASTQFGAFLDPVADKLIVAAALIIVAAEYNDLLITILTIIIIMREIMVSALREWMAQRQMSDTVAVSKMGKYKTTFQLFALGMLIYGGGLFGVNWTLFGTILLILATVLTIASWWQYLVAAWPSLNQ